MNHDEIIDQVSALIAADRKFRDRLIKTLSRLGLADPGAADRIAHTQVAVNLLDCGTRRKEIQRMLRDRYGISRPTAYRVIQAALNWRGER